MTAVQAMRDCAGVVNRGHFCAHIKGSCGSVRTVWLLEVPNSSSYSATSLSGEYKRAAGYFVLPHSFLTTIFVPSASVPPYFHIEFC